MNERSGVIDPNTIKAIEAEGASDPAVEVLDAPPESASADPAHVRDPVAPSDGGPNSLQPTLIPQADSLMSQVLGHGGELVVDDANNVYVAIRGSGNPIVLKLGSPEMNGLIAQAMRRRADRPSPRAAVEVNDELRAEALLNGRRLTVWRRVAQTSDGVVVIALHDERNTQVRIGPNSVDIVTGGSELLFYRPPTSAPMAMPADSGDYKLLRKYLNLDPVSFLLYVAWVTYTLAHAKRPGNVFVVLLLVGGQGTGKSFASKLTIRLIDPNTVGVERMPKRESDLAIASQNGHLLAYDNLRVLSHEMSDALCTVATRGSLTTRRLYTDDEQSVLTMHAALLLNGLHEFVDQPDLAQRCLPLRLRAIDQGARQSESELLARFEADLPVIQRGLFDLIARVLAAKGSARVTSPERMFEFGRWLAAMESVHDAPSGAYQDAYTQVLREGQLESVRESLLGAALLDFSEELQSASWAGTPSELLATLTSRRTSFGMRAAHGWPQNEIALSKRLVPLIPALLSQGVIVEFTRGKHRSITISNMISNEAR